MKSPEAKPPIFIIGVPRSGTTLLRVLLDSHPSIACGPEAPWLARMPLSVKSLYDFMVNSEYGYVNNYGMDRKLLCKQFSELINNLFVSYAIARGKNRWAEKTPDHSLEIPFLTEMFPRASFVFIVRDGRDVACSTSILSEERKNISPWHSDNIIISDDRVVPNTLINAALRWKVWNTKIEDSLINSSFIRIRYEDLISTPHNELKRLLSFLGEKYAPEMLNFVEKYHDYPSWEWGSADVRKSRELTNRSVRRWMKQLSLDQIREIEAEVGETLLHFGYKLNDQVNEV